MDSDNHISKSFLKPDEQSEVLNLSHQGFVAIPRSNIIDQAESERIKEKTRKITEELFFTKLKRWGLGCFWGILIGFSIGFFIFN